MKSLLNYIGKKNNIDIQNIIVKNNICIDTYCEPFGGGFSAGLNLLEKGFTGRVVLNDLDWEVYNFWIFLRDNYEELFNSINNRLRQIFKYENLDDQMQVIKECKLSDELIDKASAEYIIRKCLTMKGMKISANKFQDTEIEFFLQSKILENVVIRNCDYSDILAEYSSNTTFFLIDPPYYVDGVTNYYRCNCNYFYHRELSENIVKTNGKMIITYNDNSYIRDLYKDFDIEYIQRYLKSSKYYEIYINNFGKIREEK